MWILLTVVCPNCKVCDTEKIKIKQITCSLKPCLICRGRMVLFFFKICRVTDWRLTVIIIKIKCHCILTIAIIQLLQVKSQLLKSREKTSLNALNGARLFLGSNLISNTFFFSDTGSGSSYYL